MFAGFPFQPRAEARSTNTVSTYGGSTATSTRAHPREGERLVPYSAAARSEAKTNLPQALGRLERYRDLSPEGAHVVESRDWQKRLRGELPSLLDKTKNIDAL